MQIYSVQVSNKLIYINMNNVKILLTGCAGFIGFHITKKFIENNYNVIGIDNLNNYYSIELKKKRLEKLESNRRNKNFKFYKIDLCEKEKLINLFEKEKFSHIIHLAAQAGVRYSIKSPETYISSNISGYLNILDASRRHKIKHIYYASSSSVYGNNKKIPFNEKDKTDKPISLYGVTKKTNELMSYCYSKMYSLSITGLRFFTVYGPWGRPDMAPMIFLKALRENKPVKIFNNGDLERDFTYIDDISNSLFKLFLKDEIHKIKTYRIFNIGNSKPILLSKFIYEIERITQKKIK